MRNGWSCYVVLLPLAVVCALAAAEEPGVSQQAVLNAAAATAAGDAPQVTVLGDYVILGWNDLGMHCMGRQFGTLTILPPFNNLWVQVIHRGDPPQLTSASVHLTYRFPANTYSVGKADFWTYAQATFGLPSPLPANIGLTGHGLSGTMDWNGTAFEVTGVPITPFDDAAPTVLQPYQLAEATLTIGADPTTKDQTVFVAPVSTEMHCDQCHGSGGDSTFNAILAQHDDDEGTTLTLAKPVLCGSCHADAALGTPGTPGVSTMSYAMHHKHAEENPPGLQCYSCHPGILTQCLRDVMFSKGKKCEDCHGTIAEVASSQLTGRRPWQDEPKCATCHPDHAENSGQLYRHSTGHGGVYCAACHNSPHAVLPTVQARDSLQAVRVQGKATYIKSCLVCHTTQPLSAGPHDVITSWRINEHLAGRLPLAPPNLGKADVNKDVKLDSGDLIHQINRGL